MPNSTAAVENLRHSFRPKRIKTLFVGELAPASGAFFYDGNTQLYRYMRAALGGGSTFLEDFKSQGYFFDDLVLFPVNLLSKRARGELHREWTPSLAQRLCEYRPLAVVTVLMTIREAVQRALAEADLSHVPHYVVPFPGNGQQARFRQEFAKLLPLLPA